MAQQNDPSAKEARLAAKLRENLHRRKAQARAIDNVPPIPTEEAERKNAPATLSKQPPES